MATDIPGLSKSQLGDNARALERIREELQILLGLRGDPLDQALTVRDAMRRGLVDSLGRALTGGVTYENYYPIGTGGGGSSPDIDLTPPPTPTGLVVQAGFTQIIVQWDAPTYTQGHGQKQTNVYAVKKAPGDASLPTFDAGVTPQVFVAPGKLTVVSLPSELNTRWHIWITHETVDGVESLTPAGGVNGYNLAGAFPTTGQDITQLLGVLTGQIRESQLYASLAEPIRSIVRRADDAAEDALRSALATHDASRRALAGLLAEAAVRGTSIAQTQVLINQGDAQLAAAISLLQAVVNNPVTGVTATAAALDIVETLASDTADEVVAVANRASLLEANVNTPGTGLLARAAALETVTTAAGSGNGALASRASTLEARVTTPSSTPGDPAYNVTYAALQTEQSARAGLDGAVQALYTVRAEVSSGGRTVVGGFGLAATATASAGPRIDFGVRADQFYVAAPAGAGIPDRFPFVIRTTVTTENGVTIPVGVYMDSAYIVNLSAMWARFGTLIADSIAVGQISAANLTLGDGTVGGDLKSTSFAEGSDVTAGTGWKLTPGGTLYASGAVIYGTVYAYAGVIGGNVIDGTGIQSPGYTAGSTGWRLDTTGLVRAFASAGARVLDMAATGAQPVLKIGAALELLANGDAYFGGRLAIGTVSANGATTASASFPSLPNSAATYSTGAIAFSPAASITGVGGNISAWVSCDIRVAAESTAVDAIRVFAYLYRNGTQVDSSEVFLRSCVFPDPTGAQRVVAAEVTLISPLEPLTGAQVFTIGFGVKFYDNTGTAITPGPTAFTSYLQVVGRANLQEIKV